MKAGRFEVNFGNRRVIGNADWNNVARSWDGFQWWYAHPAVRWSGYWLRRFNAVNPTENRNSDFDIFCLASEIKQAGLEAFAIYEMDCAGLDEAWRKVLTRSMHRGNVGAYMKQHYQQFDVEFNGVYQFGERRETSLPFDSSFADRTLTISAALAALEIGATLRGSANARLAAGVDITTGDNDPNDDVWHAYDNLYYSAHPFRGHMDYFSGSDVAGLIDVMARGRTTPIDRWTFSGDLHYFWRAAQYTDFKSERTRDVGAELDLNVTTDRVAGVKLAGGASAFMPTESFAGIQSPDWRWWSYVMATVNF